MRWAAAAALVTCCLYAQGDDRRRQLNLDSFDQVWRTVKERHWDPNVGGADWSAVRDQLRPRMEKAASIEEARGILQDMLSRLRQSHFAVVPLEVYKELDSKGFLDQSHSPEESGTAGIDLRVLDGRAIVTSVEEASPAAGAGVRAGWEIVSVGGEEIAPAIERIEKQFATSTLKDLILARATLFRLNGKAGEPVRVGFRDGAGEPVALEIVRGEQKGVKAALGYFVPSERVWIRHRRIGDTGYVRFNMFMDPPSVMAGFQEAIVGCAKCDGFIIDLRGNPGGIGVMAMGMAGWFIDKPDLRLGTMHTRQFPLKFTINPRRPHFAGPLAILIDGGSGSTSEIFAGGMKDLGRARVFGTRSAGAALPSAFERLPNGDGFQFAMANYISEGGKPLEGAGVTPDEEVRLTREALLAGRDPVIEAAAKWIAQQASSAVFSGTGQEK